MPLCRRQPRIGCRGLPGVATRRTAIILDIDSAYLTAPIHALDPYPEPTYMGSKTTDMGTAACISASTPMSGVFEPM